VSLEDQILMIVTFTKEKGLENKLQVNMEVTKIESF